MKFDVKNIASMKDKILKQERQVHIIHGMKNSDIHVVCIVHLL